MKSKQPRGIRNNNPGNIDYNKNNHWKGQLIYDHSIEPRFCRFETVEYGIRALILLLQTYRRQYGLTTVSQIIGRWAPNNENNTIAYIQSVADTLGVSPTERIDLNNKAIAINLAKAIIQHENGLQPYDTATFEKAWELL
ncbi:structural protein [Providencia stuartii]|uniref:structural protein n=1 Tax=Providencia stuartii TaxID=588 RepID=UPI0024B190AD